MSVQISAVQDVFVWGLTASDTFSSKICVSWLYEWAHQIPKEIYLENEGTTKGQDFHVVPKVILTNDNLIKCRW
jgi:hypothetical protein